jgi:hypothetical protein
LFTCNISCFSDQNELGKHTVYYVVFITDLVFCSEMEVYTNAELADAHLMYGLADGNRTAAQCLYWERFPEGRCSDRKTFQAIDRRLREHGTLKPNTRDWERPRRTRTPQLEEGLEGRGHHN